MLKSKPITPDIKQERVVQITSVSRNRVLSTRENLSIHSNYGKFLSIYLILDFNFYSHSYFDKTKLRATHRRKFRFCNQLRLTVTISISLRSDTFSVTIISWCLLILTLSKSFFFSLSLSLSPLPPSHPLYFFSFPVIVKCFVGCTWNIVSP